MHQDHPFYAHENEKFIDVLIHLGDTSHANGKIRFLAGSHKQGARKHITAADDGQSTPHLPTDEYKLEDTVAVPARRGDVVAFCYYTVHGSYINTTPGPRRIVLLLKGLPTTYQLPNSPLIRRFPGAGSRGGVSGAGWSPCRRAPASCSS